MKNIFSYPDYTRLFIARLISTIGDKFFTMAITWWIIDAGLENGKIILGVIMGASTLGILLFAPFMGTLSERYNQKSCMIGALIGGALTVAAVILFFPSFMKMPLLFAVAQVTLFAFEPLFETSMQSSLNHIVEHKDLAQAATTTSGIVSISQVIGASLAGITIASLGVIGAFTIDILSFVFAIYFVFRITTILPHSKANEQGQEQAAKKPGFFTELKEGFVFVYKDKALFYLSLFFCVINIFLSPISLAVPILVKETFGGTAVMLSTFEMVKGLGIMTCIFTLSIIRKPINRYKLFFISVATIASLSICLIIPNQYAVGVALFFFGACIQAINASMMVLSQHYVPQYIQGRYFSIMNVMAVMAYPLGMSLSGVFAEIFSIQQVLITVGIMILLSSSVLIFLPKLKMNYTI